MALSGLYARLCHAFLVIKEKSAFKAGLLVVVLLMINMRFASVGLNVCKSVE